MSGDFFCARSKRLTLNLSNASLRVVGFTYLRWQVNIMVLNNNLGQNIAGKFTKISEAGFCMECFTVFITFWQNFSSLIFVNLSAVFCPRLLFNASTLTILLQSRFTYTVCICLHRLWKKSTCGNVVTTPLITWSCWSHSSMSSKILSKKLFCGITIEVYK